MPNIVKALQRQPDGTLQEVPLGQPTVEEIPYQGTINLDPTNIDIIRIVLEGPMVFNILNTGADGQKLLVEIQQDSQGSRPFTLGGEIGWGVDIPHFTPSTDPGKTDVLGFVRHQPTSTWRLIAIARGY